MIICTDDTSTLVPSEKKYPGSQKLYEWYKEHLKDDFRRESGSEGYTDKGLLKEFIGITCDQREDGSIALDMTEYKNSLVKRHGFVDAHRASTPACPGKIMSETDCAKPEDESPPGATSFRSKVGGIQWLSRVALPIVAYQVCALARFNHAPGKVHWDAVNDLMRYLSTSADAPRHLNRKFSDLLFFG